MGNLQSRALSMLVTGRATIGPENNFTEISDGAFRGIKIGEELEVEFKDNEIHRADPGALKFHKGRVRFSGSLFTGLGCPCEGGTTFNGATRMRDRLIQRLLGGRGFNEDEETFEASAATQIVVLIQLI